jgi:pyruvate dehydrogenase E1 component alpha subunit
MKVWLMFVWELISQLEFKNRDMPTTTKAKNEPAEAKKNDTTQFSKETYLYWYESMQLMRKFEEKAGQLYGMQKIKGFCHLYIGQEACASGSASALKKVTNGSRHIATMDIRSR